MKATRRQAREWAIQMLVAADLNPPVDVPAFIESFWTQVRDLDSEDGGPQKPDKRMRTFAELRVNGVLSSLPELDKLISERLVDWDIYRLGTIERAALRLGVWEMKNADVPAPVAINEAVDVANWFAGSRTRAIVNGVLDRYAKDR